MKLALVAVGRLKSGPERDLVERYRERAEALGRALGFTPIDIIEIAEGRGRRETERRAEEGGVLAQKLPPGAVIALDERGQTLSSDRFAARLAAWRDEGRPALALVIGGPDGLDPAIRARADLVLSFGALTVPHQLVRVLAMEQLYRALTILAGHPYHRAGEPGG
jgi:23S rRNA (pseudouridine1915-N3)-methyltransferase